MAGSGSVGSEIGHSSPQGDAPPAGRLPTGAPPITLDGRDGAEAGVQHDRVFFEAMGEAAATLDHEGVVLRANARLAAMLGVPAHALQGTCLLAALEGLPAALPTAGTWRGRVLIHASDGAHPCLCTLVAVESDGPELFRCVVLSDLAELERAQREADAGQRALAGLAAAAPGGLFRLRSGHGSIQLEFATDEVFRLVGVPRPSGPDAAHALWTALPEAARASLVGAWRAKRDRLTLAVEFPVAEALAEVRWLGLEARGEREPDGAEVWSGYLHDLSEVQRGEEERRVAATVFQAVRQGIMVASPQGEILHVNPGFEMITGYRAEEAIGRPAKMLASGLTPREVHAGMWAALTETGHWEGEVINRRRDGGTYHQLLTIDGVPSADGGVACYVGVFSDITARKQREEQNLFVAQHDRLTGLLNRSVLDERLPGILAQSERSGTGCSLLYVDLDRFKAVNDTFGHEAGDRVLVEVANRLHAAVRSTDLVARIGGDEFVIVLPGMVEEDDLHRFCDSLIESLHVPVEAVEDGARWAPGASIGVAIHPDDGRIAESLLSAADSAMYAVKRRGRGGFRFACEARNERLRERIRQTDDLGRALDDGRIATAHRMFEVASSSVPPGPFPALFGLHCVDALGLPSGPPVALDRLSPSMTIAISLKVLELAIANGPEGTLREISLASDLLDDDAGFEQLVLLLDGAAARGVGVAFRLGWRQRDALSALASGRLDALRQRGVSLHLAGIDANAPLPALLAGQQPAMAILDPPDLPGASLDVLRRFIRAFVNTCEACGVVPAGLASPAWATLGGAGALGLVFVAPADVAAGEAV